MGSHARVPRGRAPGGPNVSCSRATSRAHDSEPRRNWSRPGRWAPWARCPCCTACAVSPWREQGDRQGAAVALHQSLEAARVNQVDYEVALTLRVIAALGLDYGAQDSGRIWPRKPTASSRRSEWSGSRTSCARTRSSEPVVLASSTSSRACRVNGLTSTRTWTVAPGGLPVGHPGVPLGSTREVWR